MCKIIAFYFDFTYLDLMHYTNAHKYTYINVNNRISEILIFQIKGNSNLKEKVISYCTYMFSYLSTLKWICNILRVNV